MTATDFDPYATWLQIEYDPAVSDPYRLLDLSPLEADPNRIKRAFKKQEDALSRWADKADPALLERLAREVRSAYELLCDPARKAVLDATIQRRSTAAPTPLADDFKPAAGEVLCGKCQRPNPTSRRFCGSCGGSLWEKCPKCGGECSTEERFCGQCGTDVAVGLSLQAKECELRLDEASKFLAGQHFDQALRTLRRVAATSDRRLERYAAQALAEIPQVEAAKQAAQETARQALAEAEQYLSQHAYEQALVALDAVPPALRSEDHAALFERASNCRNEVLALSGEIRLAVEQKRMWDLSAKLERLLGLMPQHAQARQLAEQLREHYLKNARARLREFKYQAALEQIEQVSLVVSNETVEQLRDTASELARLTREVREAALADQPHMALAQRLTKLAPNDSAASRMLAEIGQKAKKPPASPRLGAPDFAQALKRSHMGPPVDWLAHFQRAQPADEQVAATLRAHPGQFFVALGLALHGLGAVAMDADLTPRASRGGMLGALAPLNLGRRTASSAWGLDLSDHSLKAIQLVATGRGEVLVKNAIHRAIPRLSEQSEAQQAEAVQRVLTDFATATDELKGAKICVDFPDQRVLGRFFELPPMPAKKLADSIQYEVRHQIPIPLDELCWSHAILGPTPAKGADDQPRRLFVQAARETQVRDRMGRFKEAGISVDLVQSSAVALHNALRFEFAAEEPWGKVTLAALDVGSIATNVVVSSPDGVWFRTFGQGGEVWTRELVRQLQVTSDQAAKLLREPWRARRFHQWIDALQPLYVQFGSEVLRSIATYQRLCPESPVQQLVGLGGAFPTVGLLRYLRSGQ